MDVMMIQVELTEEQIEQVKALEAAADEDGLALLISKIGAEQAKARERATFLIKLRADALTELMENVHFLLHQKQNDRALALLCPAVAMFEDPSQVELEVVLYVQKEMHAVTAERERFSCKGSA